MPSRLIGTLALMLIVVVGCQRPAAYPPALGESLKGFVADIQTGSWRELYKKLDTSQQALMPIAVFSREMSESYRETNVHSVDVAQVQMTDDGAQLIVFYELTSKLFTVRDAKMKHQSTVIATVDQKGQWRIESSGLELFFPALAR